MIGTLPRVQVPRAIVLSAGAIMALTLAACGSADDTLNFGAFTDCAKVGAPVVTNDPAGDQRHTSGIKDTTQPKGDLVRLRVAKSADRLCAEFTVREPIRPYVAYVLTMRPQSSDTPVVQLEATVLAGQAPDAQLDARGTGRSFRKIKAKVGIEGDKLSILVDRARFDAAGVGAIFRSFRFQARSAVAAKDEGRLTDCMPVCQ
jgi:hypothetical protein